jgi:hypothetical protein
MNNISGWWLKNHLEKWWSESQWGWDDIPYMKWQLKFMFETTNQCFLFAFWKKHILKFFANLRLFQHLQMAFITCSTWKPQADPVWNIVKLYLSWSDLLWYLHIFKINYPFIDGLPIKNGDFPWQTVSHNQMVNEMYTIYCTSILENPN